MSMTITNSLDFMADSTKFVSLSNHIVPTCNLFDDYLQFTFENQQNPVYVINWQFFKMS